MKFAITLGQLNPALWVDATVAAEGVGFESVWLPEHLVFPMRIEGQLVPGEDHAPVPPTIPVFDAAAYLSFLAARTERIRLGTFVYLLGIRHPFVSARAFATLAVLSGGRAICGVGAGWLRTEWEAVGLDPATRGRRLDEAIEVCRRLWRDEVIEHHGTHFDFEPVAFEPKPPGGAVPLHVGGESAAALRRVGRVADGWLGMDHTPETARARVDQVREAASAAGRDPSEIEITVVGAVGGADAIDAYRAAGVDRLIVTPWRRSREALDAIARFAADHDLGG